MPTPPKLDHTVINVGYQMDEAEPRFQALGFYLTERGFHSGLYQSRDDVWH